MLYGVAMIVLLFVALAICAFVGLGFLLLSGRGKSSGILSIVLGGSALLVFFFVMSMAFVGAGTYHQIGPRKVHVEVNPEDSRSERSNLSSVQISYTSEAEESSDSEPPVEPSKTQTKSETELTAEQTDEKQPDWIEQLPGRDGKIYRTSVVSDPKLTNEECDESLNGPIMEVAREYVDQLLGRGASETIGLDVEQVRQDVCKAEYYQPHESPTVGKMVRLHVLMEFDEPFRNQMRQRYREAVVQQRMVMTGGGAFSILLILGSIFGYLQIDTATKGFYTGRLQLATAVVILTVLLLGMVMLA